ncbi:MAG: c-type cytochrome [Syntrophobacteraceae bacterium]
MRIILFLLIMLSVTFALPATQALAEDGAAIFHEMKCDMCHRREKRAAAVSLADIVKAYSDREKLMGFFKGETKPLIESEKWGLMRGPLSKIQALSNPEKEALADYVLSFK